MFKVNCLAILVFSWTINLHDDDDDDDNHEMFSFFAFNRFKRTIWDVLKLYVMRYYAEGKCPGE